MTPRGWLYAYLIVMTVLSLFNTAVLVLDGDSVTAIVSLAVGIPLWTIGWGLAFGIWRLVRQWRRMAAAPLVDARLVGADGEIDLYEYVVPGHPPHPFRHERKGESPAVLRVRVIPGESAETLEQLRKRGVVIAVFGVVLGAIGLGACALGLVFLPGTSLYYVFM